MTCISCGEEKAVVEAERMSCFTLLMADDDPDDRFLTQEACRELMNCGDLRFVEDGEELMRYLLRQGRYADPTVSPRPKLILLDLNMPKKDGRRALAEIKTDPDLRRIPVVVWTTSEEKEDRIQCLKAGADDYITVSKSEAGIPVPGSAGQRVGNRNR
jgi:CheY-like chemotaxis protein